jgi:hypothetical protein
MKIMVYVTVTVPIGLEIDGDSLDSAAFIDDAALERAVMNHFVVHPAFENPEQALWAGVERIEYEIGESE